MKNFMAIAACGLAILLTAGLCVTGIRQAMADCDGCFTTGCGSTSSVELTPATDSVTAAAMTGNFQRTFCFHWQYPTDQPDYIVFEFNDDPVSNNIDEDNTSYSPSLITNTNCCTGYQGVTITGKLDDPGQDGTLQTKGWASVPYREDTHTLAVSHQ